MGHVMVVAGEVSGDMHAARVVEKIKEIAPETSFSGMGTTGLKDTGVNILIDPTEISTIGFIEALKNINKHLSHIKLLKEHIKKKNPDVLFLVDYSGFNMVMARIGHKLGIPVVNYFPPTAWIWGEWRARWMAKNNITIASAFPLEKKIYEKAGADVSFVGHPLLDIVQVEESSLEIYDKLELNSEKRVVGLLPGSRNSEIESLLPKMLDAAEKLQQDFPDLQFVLPLAPDVDQKKISAKVGEHNVILKIVDNYTYQTMKIADLVITASGTATLESLIMKTPMIVLYETSWSTYQLGKRLMNVEYIGLPNIIAGKEVVPELIQEQVSGENIFEEAVYLLKREYVLQNMGKKLESLKDKLGGPGAVEKTARLVLNEGGLI